MNAACWGSIANSPRPGPTPGLALQGFSPTKDEGNIIVADVVDTGFDKSEHAIGQAARQAARVVAHGRPRFVGIFLSLPWIAWSNGLAGL